MASETLTLDPTASPVELALGTSGFQLVSFDSPPPNRKRVEATSQDTEGSVQVASQYENRTVTIVVRTLPATTRTLWYARLAQLSKKVGKVNREGGVIKRIGIGSVVNHYYDLVDGAGMITWDKVRYALRMDMEVTLTFLARPFAREDEIALSVHTETLLPCLTFTETNLKGDVPANGRLVITDTQGVSQNAMWWGEQSRYYDPAATALLYYEAEKLTLLDATGLVTNSPGAIPAPGSGTNCVEHNTLPGGQWCPVLSTDIVASGKMTHKGNYQVLARCKSVTVVPPQVRLSYGLGDLTNFKTNAPVSGSSQSFQILDLGKIQLGTSSQWTGVIQALATTTGDNIYIDSIMLIPVDEGTGKAVAVQQPSPAALAVSKLSTVFADPGGIGTLSWTGTPKQATTTNSGQLQTHYLNCTGAGFALPSAALVRGISVVISRMAGLGNGSDSIVDWSVKLLKAGVLAGNEHANPGIPYSNGAYTPIYYGGPTDLWGTTWLYSDINAASFGVAFSSTLNKVDFAADTVYCNSATITVYYGTATVPDVVMSASRSMQIASDGVTRQNAAGTFWVPESAYQGDYLTVPPAGVEGRSTRFIVKASEMSASNQNVDTAVDDISAQLFYTPRWLMHPDS